MKSFAKILAFYMLFCGLIPKTDINQLSYLPDLIVHYRLHKVIAKNLCLEFSVSDFLITHFVTPDDHHHEGNDGHQNLPFYSFHTAVTFILLTVDAPFLKKAPTLNYIKISYQSIFYLNGFVAAVFHPPSSF